MFEKYLFNMSSGDSDDEFSYINSAKLLKNIKQKMKSNIRKDDGSDDLKVISLDTNKTKRNAHNDDRYTKPKRSKQVRRSEEDDCCVIENLENSSKTISNEEINDSVVILKESVENYSEMLAKVDKYINMGKKQNKSRKSRYTPKSTRRNTRSSARHNTLQHENTTCVDTIVIDPDFPILNSEPTVPDDVNEEVTIYVIWKSQKKIPLKIRKFQPLKKLFQHFADREDISEDRLFFTYNDRVITMKDTVHSLNMKLVRIIEGGILSNKTHLTSGITYSQDIIELKVQLKDRKKPLLISIKVTDEMSALMVQCSEELDIPVKNLKFTFDGDVILPNQTPTGLEFEGGECIDCVVTKF